MARALRDALSYPLIVLAAPMGYGKTTTLRAFADGLAHSVFFLTVNQGAGSARYLWDVLCGQLAAAGSLSALLPQRWGFPEDDAAMDGVLQDIRDAPRSGPVLLIVDDWHFAEFPEFDFFLERLVRERIPGLTLLLSSRTRPGLPLEDLRIKGLAQVFGRDLLAFSETEAAAYFGMQGIDDAQTAKEAWRVCEGWPAALWLKAQEHKAQGENNSTRDVEKLLESVILPQCGPEERRLLMQLSLLDNFTFAQASLVSGDKDAPRRLERLRDRDAFVHDDPASGGFRLHAMFRAFLNALLNTKAETFGIDKAALHRRVGESLLAEGDMVKAARFFFLAGRDEDYLRLLEIFALPRSNLSQFLSAAEIAPLALAIPWPLRLQRPLEYLTFIYCYLAEADPFAVAPLLEEAERRFAEDESIPAALRRRLQGEALLIRSLLVFNDIRAMRDIYEEAHKLLDGRSRIASRRLIWNFACPHAAYLYLREPGDYRPIVELAENNLRYYQELSDGCSLGAEPLFRAELLLETGRFGSGDGPEIEQLLLAAIHRGESKDQIATMLSASFSLARLYVATGRAQDAISLLEGWIPKIHALGHVDLNACLELSLGYIHACLGRRDDIPEWLSAGEIEPSRNIAQILGFIHAVRGKAALLSGDYARLDTMARSLPVHLGPFDNLFGRIHAGTMEAIAAQHLYGMEKASEIMRRLLDLARPDGIVLSIAEYGGPALPILRKILAETPQDAFVKSLTLLTKRLAREQSAACSARPKKTRLSSREAELLHLAAKGKSNAAIAAHLGIAPGTVKKILSSAYVKLKAKNRAEAVRKFAGPQGICPCNCDKASCL